MISDEENKKQKEIFLQKYFPSFTPYLSLEKLEQKIPSYLYLNNELKKLEETSPEGTIKHVMGKKKLLISKNAKQLCRDGIPVKNIKEILLKMFNVNYSNEDYDNKRKDVLKGREFSEMGDQVPTFCDKSLEEVLPFHYLNDQGLEALKEVLWLLNGVLPKLEYSPGVAGLASILLLFLSKEETYELVRNLIEADLNPGDLANIRWHFRYSLDDNIKLYISISLSILELTKQEIVNQFQQIENYGLKRIKLVQDIVDKFFIDYINFIGIIKFLPFFLYEGAKGIYRFIYGIIALNHFKIEKKEKDEEKKEGELETHVFLSLQHQTIILNLMKLKHKTIITCLACAWLTLSTNAKSLVLVLADGTEAYYNIDTQSAIMHLVDGNVVIETDSYQFSDIKRFFISNDDAPSAIGNIDASKPISQDGILYIPNQDSAILYTIDGKQVAISQNGTDTQSFNMGYLPTGTYLVKTKKATLKFTKK